MTSAHWSTSTRRSRLPSDWTKRRDTVRRKANDRCEWIDDGQRCPKLGTDCDHINNANDHSIDNLQWLCSKHHKKKSAAEAIAARRHRPSRLRAPEQHPGAITP